ncbi:farnesol dehydrogenase-like [Homalodisca vitripennis]|uniref:farnesol dehydrogenase-like n=1 Tax=Homalodisca vitripennis TaxID=197043 RepID=UPI001EEA51E8|nr:farnesol dehydrogenase-like [Homalodisca vitripennis]XP_046672668.1 farnesol dehydrogenase-like [Homalodisca vitripennis]XP_046672669.1 farnesol dehydrogenase-like [Homalodisca vitripennis]
MERWQGRVAVVTGASAGIGAAIVEDLVESGMVVVGLARRENLLLEIQDKLKGKSGTFHPIKADITKEEDFNKAFEWIKEHLGGIDVLVNNAGVIITSYISDCNIEEWRKMYELNVFAVGACSREAVKSMRERNVCGHVININSISSHWIPNFPGISPYSSTKHAAKVIGEGLRIDLSSQNSKIKVTSISPGLVDTEMLDSFKEGKNLNISFEILTAKDVADAVHYVLGTPPNVQVTELIIRPIGEGV